MSERLLAHARLIDFLPAQWIDQADYNAGWQLGIAGKPDPMGKANWAMWNGWHDGATRGGFLPRRTA